MNQRRLKRGPTEPTASPRLPGNPSHTVSSRPAPGQQQKTLTMAASISALFAALSSATVAAASKTIESLVNDSASASSSTKSPLPPSSSQPLDDKQTYELQVMVPSTPTVDHTSFSLTDPPNVSQSQFIGRPAYCHNLTRDDIIYNFTECLPALPKILTFSEDNAISVAAYSCLFVIAACGNLTVFITLFRNRNVKSRINLFIMHLAIADLMVTFLMMPLEIAWHSVVAWKAGDAACRILMFFRAIGLYLSTCILVSISLDRYIAIMRPLSISDADTRCKIMLTASWVIATIASIPQSFIFHVEAHPVYRFFKQCVTFNFFPTSDHELAYNMFTMIALYCLPLTIMTSSYSVILIRISKKTRQSRDQLSGPSYNARRQDSPALRRSGVGNIERARMRTLKMTLVIVGAYLTCWTPYMVICAWFYFDKKSAESLDPKVQRGLLLFGVSNSCINPLVYGMFTIKFERELARCCYCLRGVRRQRSNLDSNGVQRSLLAPMKRNSESSSSSKTMERSTRLTTAHQCQTPEFYALSPQSLRYTFISPAMAEVKTSNSRASLNSQGRGDERANLNALSRDERVTFTPAGQGTSSSASVNFYRDDRANMNNFIKLGSPDC